MTDQELNLKCVEYLGLDYELFMNQIMIVTDISSGNIRKESFSPATNANDAMLVFDKLKGEHWTFYSHGSDGRVAIEYLHIDTGARDLIWADTTQEANRAVLEKIMNIINGSD